MRIEDGWITLEDWCEKTGETRNVVHARIHAGRWQRGVEYSAPDGGSCFVHQARAQAWVDARKKK